MTKVVIVDDALLVRVQLKKFFEEKLGFEVVGQGEDGEEAVSLYQKLKPDLMTMDLTMPNKNGIEAIREILEFDKLANILIVTAIKDRSLITNALHLGAKGYVNKPIQLDSIDFVDAFKVDVESAIAN